MTKLKKHDQPGQMPRLQDAAAVEPPSLTTRLKAHVAIMRLDHWVKNVFILPGILVARTLGADAALVSWRTVVGILAVCLASSSNYVINEVVDAPFDRHHPTKRLRPVPGGLVAVRAAYAQWLLLFAAAAGLAATVSTSLAWAVGALWLMGCLYNLRPIRLKDLVYLDVLAEAVNNPIRLGAGWYIAASHLVLPLSLVISYWMLGCYFMTIKRYAELRMIPDPMVRGRYRKSLGAYTEARLLVAAMFFSSSATLFFGAFIMRYRMELLLSFPLLALVMALYLALAFRDDSAAQAPEKLWREPQLVLAGVLSVAVICYCLTVDMPALHHLFPQTFALSAHPTAGLPGQAGPP